jgi:hypothetical protein
MSAEQAKDLDGFIPGSAEPVRDAGIELSDLARAHRDITLSQDQPHSPGQYVEPAMPACTACVERVAHFIRHLKRPSGTCTAARSEKKRWSFACFEEASDEPSVFIWVSDTNLRRYVRWLNGFV